MENVLDKDRYVRAVAENRVIHVVGDVKLELVKSVRDEIEKFLQRENKPDLVKLTVVEGYRERPHTFYKPKRAKEGPIVLLDSTGGDVAQGRALCDELARLAAIYPDLLLLAGAKVCSIAVSVALSVPRNRRLASPMTALYVHRSSLGYETKAASTNVDSLEYAALEAAASAKLFGCDKERSRDQIARGTGMTKEEVEELIEHPRYLLADEAVKLGFFAGIFTA